MSGHREVARRGLRDVEDVGVELVEGDGLGLELLVSETFPGYRGLELEVGGGKLRRTMAAISLSSGFATGESGVDCAPSSRRRVSMRLKKVRGDS